MKNNKGFTLVEILAVVVILGILTGVAVPAVSHFINKSRQKSYEMMKESLKEAAFNYVMNEGVDLSEFDEGYFIWFDSDVLVDEKYLETLIDPANKNKTCTGRVGIRKIPTSEWSTDSIDDFIYCIHLKCSKGESRFGNCIIPE